MQCLCVVDFRIDTDPEFRKIRPNNFICHFCTANVTAKIQHARNVTKFATGQNGDAIHGFDGRPGFLNEVHQEIGLLKIRQEFLSQAVQKH